MDKLNDQYYINLVLEGEPNAFAILVNRYKDLVFTLSLKMLQNREEAEEAAQDTFVKIYKSLDKFKGESKLSSWIYKICYNNCLDRLKKQKTKRPVLPINEFTEHKVKSLINILDTIEENERKQMIKSCLDLLPAEDSFLLTLYYFNENSLKEIAAVMGVNENNVKIKLYRARKKLTGILRTKLEPEIIDQYEK